MTPIVEYPTVVSSSLPAFRNVFNNRPRLQNFGNYLTGLILSPNRTVSYINDAFYAHKDQSALNHFLTDSNWSDEELDGARYEYILEGLERNAGDAQGEGVLAVDDTLAHKTGKHMELAGIFWDHAEGRYTLAHDVLTTHLVKGRLSVPIDLDIYVKKDEFEKEHDDDNDDMLKELGKGFRTKNQMLRELVSKAASKKIPFSRVVADEWFFNRDNTSHIESLGKDWVFESSSDRLIMSPKGWVNLSDWAKTIPEERFKPVEASYQTKKHTYWCYSKNVTMSRMEGRVNVIVSYDNSELKGDPKFLATNRQDWDEFRIVRTYTKRWQIDAFYRDAKQNLGLEDYEVRKTRGVKRHLAMVLIAHTILVLGSPSHGADAAKAEAVAETIGSRSRFAYTEILTSFVSLVLKVAGELKNDANMIVSMMLSSRAALKGGFAKV